MLTGTLAFTTDAFSSHTIQSRERVWRWPAVLSNTLKMLYFYTCSAEYLSLYNTVGDPGSINFTLVCCGTDRTGTCCGNTYGIIQHILADAGSQLIPSNARHNRKTPHRRTTATAADSVYIQQFLIVAAHRQAVNLRRREAVRPRQCSIFNALIIQERRKLRMRFKHK